MDKVIMLDQEANRFRIYFTLDQTLLGAVRDLPERCFMEDGEDRYWSAGTTPETAVALGSLAFNYEFVMDAHTARAIEHAYMTGASDSTRCAKITGAFAAQRLISVSVRCPYQSEVVDLLKSVVGSVWHPNDKAWKLPSHHSTRRAIKSLVRHYGLDVDPTVIDAIQAELKAAGEPGYVEECRDLDSLLPHLHAVPVLAPTKTFPPLAVVSTKAIATWVANVGTRKLMARAKSSSRRAAERAEERGFGEEAATLTTKQIQAVHANLRVLAGVCDGAAARDDVGFNGPDSKIGRTLALLPALEPIHAAYARSFLGKYKRQLGSSAIEAMG